MNEVEAVERVPLVFDAAIHVCAARLAGVPLDGLRGVDDVKLVTVLQHGDILTRHHGDDRKNSALRFPALGTAASVIVRDVTLDADLDRLVFAFADEHPAGKVA